MTYVLLSTDMVDRIHDAVLNPGELTGHAMNKSLAGAMGRVDNRLAYGMIEDVFDLAAAYCVAIATGHVFNDANKRTAYKSMIVFLHLNGISIHHNTTEAGDTIIRTAQGLIDEADLAAWLRTRVS